MPRYSLASVTLAAAPPSTVATESLPVSRGCPCVWLTTSRHSSQKHPVLGHCLLLRLGDPESDRVPGGLAVSPLSD